MKRSCLITILTVLLLSAFGCQKLESLRKDLHETIFHKEPLPEEVLALFPDAAAVRALETGSTDESYSSGRSGSVSIERADAVINADDNVIGYRIVVSNRDAYNPPLTLALGISPDGETTGIYFLELNEIPGKGSKADEPAFKDQFIGKTADSFELFGTGDNGIDGISGATVTSKAVVNAVNAALDWFRNQ